MQILERFHIGEPIKSLFQPKFSIDALSEGQCIKIRLDARAPDAYGKGIIPVLFVEMFSSRELNDDTYMALRLRSMLHKLLLHEADESILVNGVRIFDPHK